MSLTDFLRDPRHFVARERMLHMKASLEIKIAAASCGEQLQMTEPEIDNQGFDFTVALGFDVLYVQNKATMSGSKVSSFEIHPLLLQIPFLERDIAPHVAGRQLGATEGAMGAVLLHEVCEDAAAQGRLEVRYHYFDIFHAAAVANGLWISSSFSPDEASDLVSAIENGVRGDRVALPRRAMLPVRSPAALVSLRFHLPHGSNYISLGRLPTGELHESLRDVWRAEVGQWLP